MKDFEGFDGGNFDDAYILARRDQLIEELAGTGDKISQPIKDDILAIYEQIDKILPEFKGKETNPEALKTVIANLNQEAKILLQILVTKDENTLLGKIIDTWNKYTDKDEKKDNWAAKTVKWVAKQLPSLVLYGTAIKAAKQVVSAGLGTSNIATTAITGAVLGGTRAWRQEVGKQFSPEAWLKSVIGEDYQKAIIEKTPDQIAAKLNKADVPEIEKTLAFLNEAIVNERKRLGNIFNRMMPKQNKDAQLVAYARVMDRLTKARQIVLDQDKDNEPLPAQPGIGQIENEGEQKNLENINSVLDGLLAEGSEAKIEFDKMVKSKNGEVFVAGLKGAALGSLKAVAMVEIMGFLGETLGGWFDKLYHGIVGEDHPDNVTGATEKLLVAEEAAKGADQVRAHWDKMSDADTDQVYKQETEQADSMVAAHDSLEKAAGREDIDYFKQPEELTTETGSHYTEQTPEPANAATTEPTTPATTEPTTPATTEPTTPATTEPTTPPAVPPAVPPTSPIIQTSLYENQLKPEVMVASSASENVEIGEAPKLEVAPNDEISDGGVITNQELTTDPTVVGDDTIVENQESNTETLATGGDNANTNQDLPAGESVAVEDSSVEDQDIKTESLTGQDINVDNPPYLDGNDPTDQDMKLGSTEASDIGGDVDDQEIKPETPPYGTATTEIEPTNEINPDDIVKTVPLTPDLDGVDVDDQSLVEHPRTDIDDVVDKPEVEVATDLPHLVPEDTDVDGSDGVGPLIDRVEPLEPDTGDVVDEPYIDQAAAPDYNFDNSADFGSITPTEAPTLNHDSYADRMVSTGDSGGSGGNLTESADGKIDKIDTPSYQKKDWNMTPPAGEKIENVTPAFDEKPVVIGDHKALNADTAADKKIDTIDTGADKKMDTTDTGADKKMDTTETDKKEISGDSDAKLGISEPIPDKPEFDQAAANNIFARFELPNTAAGLAEALKSQYGIELDVLKMQELEKGFPLLKNFDECKYLDTQLGEGASGKLAREIFKNMLSDPTTIKDKMEALEEFWKEENALENKFSELNDLREAETMHYENYGNSKEAFKDAKADAQEARDNLYKIVWKLGLALGISGGVAVIAKILEALGSKKAPKPSTLAEKIIGPGVNNEKKKEDIVPKNEQESTEYLKNKPAPFDGEFVPAEKEGEPVLYHIRDNSGEVVEILTLTEKQFADPVNLPKVTRDIKCNKTPENTLLITSEVIPGQENGKAINFSYENKGLITETKAEFEAIITSDYKLNGAQVRLRPTADYMKSKGFETVKDGEFMVKDFDDSDAANTVLKCECKDADDNVKTLDIKSSDMDEVKNGFIWLLLTKDAKEKAVEESEKEEEDKKKKDAEPLDDTQWKEFCDNHKAAPFDAVCESGENVKMEIEEADNTKTNIVVERSRFVDYFNLPRISRKITFEVSKYIKELVTRVEYIDGDVQGNTTSKEFKIWSFDATTLEAYINLHHEVILRPKVGSAIDVKYPDNDLGEYQVRTIASAAGKSDPEYNCVYLDKQGNEKQVIFKLADLQDVTNGFVVLEHEA